MVNGDGKGTDMFEDNDDEAIFVDTFKSALDALEGTVEELYHAAFFAEKISVRQKGAVVVLSFYIHGSHEVLHLAVWDSNDNGRLVGHTWLDSHILHRHTATVIHL